MCCLATMPEYYMTFLYVQPMIAVCLTADAAVDDKLIFISYKRESQPTVLKIRERLRTTGFRVWIDLESIGTQTTVDLYAFVGVSNFLLTRILPPQTGMDLLLVDPKPNYEAPRRLA